VIYDAKLGYVLTNNHVVERADKIMVTLTDRRQLEAKLVAADPQTDIAILKVPAQGLTSLALGESKTLHVGDYVVAIGNPFGVGQTATFGIVSALGRTGLGIDGYEDFIQTDASINLGNSGGALIDTQGRLIGMNSAILSRGGGNVGIGFAVPIDMIKTVAAQLISKGKVSRGALGVTIQDLTPTLAQAMNVSVSEGALVSQVAPQSAAAKAGFAQGDVITALDGERVIGSAQLRNAIGQRQPGTTVDLTFIRDGKERRVIATLDVQEENVVKEQPSAPPDNALPSGLMLAPIPRNDSNFGKVNGAYVAGVEPGSVAEDAELKQGDIIVSAGRVAVNSPNDLMRILKNQKKGVPLLLQIRRGNTSLYAAIG
jgi:Do/DeqQ family serine protease